MKKKPKKVTPVKAPVPKTTKKLTLADAIALVEGRHKITPLTDEATEVLREITERNDIQTNHNRRIGWRMACEILASHGWTGRTIRALDHACREQLARSSYSTP
jgi:hypothetical protein